MAYDYAGSWDTHSGHQANLHPDPHNTACTPFSTATAVAHYARFISPHKLVIGLPLYGRAFTNTAGPGTPFSGVGEGNWENGVWDAKALPRPGAEEVCDERIGASWSYDGEGRVMVSYDTKRMAEVKGRWIKEKGLGGGMWWESSGDRKEGGLIEAVSFGFCFVGCGGFVMGGADELTGCGGVGADG